MGNDYSEAVFLSLTSQIQLTVVCSHTVLRHAALMQHQPAQSVIRSGERERGSAIPQRLKQREEETDIREYYSQNSGAQRIFHVALLLAKNCCDVMRRQETVLEMTSIDT